MIVALVGNITEHGSAVFLAARGELTLAAEIGLASAAQVAGFLIPAVVILSWAIDPLALSLRPIELASIWRCSLDGGDRSLASEDVAAAWGAARRGLWRSRRSLLLAGNR